MNAAQYEIALKNTRGLFLKYSLMKKTSEVFGVRTILGDEPDREDYLSTYQKAVDTFSYDLLLFDESLLQFSRSSDTEGRLLIRYAYYECPYEFVSYEEYLSANEFSYLDIGEAFRDDYEQALSEASLKKHINYIRYDYSMQTYHIAIHPASHLHIGLTGSIRIPIHMIITPYLFSLFILKQCYYNHWKRLMTETAFQEAVHKSKVSCSLLSAAEFHDLDKHELYLI